jgi:tRNA A-37 threonylcarbamoyl transferase component Bud32
MNPSPPVFQRVQEGPRTWLVRIALVSPEILQLLEDPDSFLEREAVIRKKGSECLIGTGRGVALKRFHTRRWLSRFKDIFRPSRAARACRRASQLELAGIPSPRPLATCTVRRFGMVLRSYLLMEEVPAAIHLFEWSGDKRIAIHSLAQCVGRLHAAGFSHRDLKETNIVFNAAGQVTLLDVDGVRCMKAVPRRRALADLARLIRGAARHHLLSKPDRVRFLQTYCATRGQADWKQWWLDLQTKPEVVTALAARPSTRV